jgi:predicted MFS family arabinose efflux permease
LPFRIAGWIALVGSAGVALLAVRSVPVHVVATLVGFAGGWIWPVFTNFGVVRANAGRAAAATGITQTGVYIGVFVGPLATGWLIEHGGYGPMWTVTAVAMAIGAIVSIRVADQF